MNFLDLADYFINFNTTTNIDTYQFSHIEKPLNDMVMIGFYNLILCQIAILIIYY